MVQILHAPRVTLGQVGTPFSRSAHWGTLSRPGQIGPCLLTPISPTPVSPTLDQKVVFRLLIKNCIFGHQSDVKLHLEVG